jgi:nicotinamidase-related amidase
MPSPAKNPDLHGSAPDKSSVALVLVDVINEMDFPGGDSLARHALPMARRILALKRRAAAAGVPTIYVNDNFGIWRSDFRKLVAATLNGRSRGARIARLLRPGRSDYFVLKPKLSAFYATPLDLLLSYLQVRTLILAGVAANICVLYSAMDAYMRDYHLIVPSDCVASNTLKLNRAALAEMKTILKADTTPSSQLDLRGLAGRHRM